MNIRRHGYLVGSILAAAAVFGLLMASSIVVGSPDSAETLAPTPQTPAPQASASPAPAVTPAQALHLAAESMAHGDFELARRNLESLPPKSLSQAAAQELTASLASYDSLTETLTQARRHAYQEHIDKLTEVVATARWREKLLQASVECDLQSDQKQRQEEQFAQEIDEDWVAALAKLTIAHELADRVNLADTVDPNLRRHIIDEAVATAQQKNSQGQWIESYSRYSLLARLDKANSHYAQQSRRAWRQAVLAEMYVSDPNQDAVSWQERRGDITFNIFALSLRNLTVQYVEEPDFRDMADRALHYCLLLGETTQLAETFEQLNDNTVAIRYRDALENIRRTTTAEESSQFGRSELLELLREVERVNIDTISLPDEVIIAEFAEGAFAALDGYTYVVWPADVPDFRKDMTNEFSGVGIEISKIDGRLKVNSLLDDSPAERAGLDAGDTIVAIDHKSTTNITLEMAVHRITGSAGTNVVLTIDREGFDQPRDFTITRGRISVLTVKGLYRDAQGDWQYWLDPANRIGYVRLKGFSGKTTHRLRQTLYDLRRDGLRGLVLDLRDNSGGFLSTAVEVVDTFVSYGRIVSTRGRFSNDEQIKFANTFSTFDLELPLVVLVNSISASASEIVSGALKDHRRALIVGSRTYGKGNVQTIQYLQPTSAQMKMTIAYYYLPLGRRVHRDIHDRTNEDYGVEPDVVVELTNQQLQQLRKVRREAETLHRNDRPESDRTWTVYSPVELIESDPQLNVALLCLKGRVVARLIENPSDSKLVFSPAASTEPILPSASPQP